VKELWIEIPNSISDDSRSDLLKSAAQFCDAILIDVKDMEKARNLGAKIAANSDESDINLISTLDKDKVDTLKRAGRTVAVKVTIRGKSDEEAAIKAAELSSDYIVINCPDWKVIPLENLIAKTRGKSKLLVEVTSAKEAKLAL
jgi:3-dehydroquinate synthase class II